MFHVAVEQPPRHGAADGGSQGLFYLTASCQVLRYAGEDALEGGPAIRPIQQGVSRAGNAVTVLVTPGDNWMFHVAVA
jgi:4-hydroxy-4-methyl-2-oxoglutarate aldolase